MKKILLQLLVINLFYSTADSQTTVQLSPSQDNSIYSDSTINSNGTGKLFCGKTCTGNIRRSLMMFDLSSIPCGVTVTDVSLTLDVSQVSGSISISDYDLHLLTSDWGEGTSFSTTGTGAAAVFPDATWIYAKFGVNSWTTPGGDFGASSATTTMSIALGTQIFSSTASLVADVQGWIDVSSSNFGWMMTGDEATVCSSRQFGSKNSGIAPILEVTYNLPDASFNYSASSYCLNSANPSPTITGIAGGIFSADPAGLSINAGTGTIISSTSTPGTYTVTYTTPGACASSTQSVTINALSNAGFNYSVLSYCVNSANPTPTITGLAGGIFSSAPAGLSINAGTGTILVSTSTPGTYTVTYTTVATCPNSSTQSVTINALSNAGFNYSSSSYCVNSANPTPTITGLAGGIFSSAPAGLSINAGTGTILVSTSTPGTYTVTYTTVATCPNSSTQSVTINALSNAGFSYGATSYCVNSANPTPTITGIAGGIFSGAPAGLSINAGTGTIIVSTSTPGTYTVTYSVTGTCPNSSTRSVTINALSNAGFNYSSSSYCVNSANPTPTITGLAGGVFSSTPAGLSINSATGTIIVSTSTPGTYAVMYSVTGTCPNSSTHSVTISLVGDASFQYSSTFYCSNSANPNPVITGQAGGVFSSSPSGLAIDGSTGIIDISTSALGTYLVTYIVSGLCSDSTNQSVTINALSNAGFNYSTLSYCVSSSNPTPIITGLAGGIFSGAPAGLNINSTTGLINLSSSTPGTYTVTYTTVATCPNSSTQTVNVIALSNAGFNYSASSYCINNPNTTPSITGLVGGVFSSAPAGLSINTATGTIIVSTSTPGSYTVTYSVTGTCPNSSTQSVSISSVDDASFNYSSGLYCNNDISQTPTISGLAGGSFSGVPAGIVLDSISGQIDLSNSLPGTYTITYLTNGLCPDSSIQSVTFNVVDTSVTVSSPTLTANALIAIYQWIDCNTRLPIPGEINQTFTATISGSYAVAVSENGCTDTSNCYNITLLKIDENNFLSSTKIFPNPTLQNVHIVFNETYDFAEIKVFDIIGQKILSFSEKEINKFEFGIDKAGIYFVDILTNKGQRGIFKVVKE